MTAHRAVHRVATILTEEVASKTATHVTMRTQLARFPLVKGLDAFDFNYQPSLDKKQIQTLSSCHFIEHGENLVILGPPGVGKTHLAVGLGLNRIAARPRFEGRLRYYLRKSPQPVASASAEPQSSSSDSRSASSWSSSTEDIAARVGTD